MLSVQPGSFIGLQLPSVLARKTTGLDASGSQKVREESRPSVSFEVEHSSVLQTFMKFPRIAAAPLAIWLSSELLGRGSSGASPRRCGG